MPIYHDGVHPVVPPDQCYEGLVDSDGGWYPVNTIPEDELKKPYHFEYASTRDLNETLKGIAEAN